MEPLYDLSWLQPNQNVTDWAAGKGRITTPYSANESYVSQPVSAWSDKLVNGIGLLNSGLGIANTISQSAKIHNNPHFDAAYNEMRNYGTRDYSSIHDLSASMSAINSLNMQQDYDKVRGMNGWQKAGAIGSSALSGFAAGSKVGGIWGGIAGTVIGGVGGLLGVKAGDRRAGIQTRFDNMQAGNAYGDAMATANAAQENLADYQHRGLAMRVAANGGQIQRRQMDINEFAGKVLGKKGSLLPKRTYCKGGVMVKVKMK